MLNQKQLRFCEEYTVDLNGTQAAIRAGYSKKTARQIADALLSKVDIKAKVSELQEQIAERNKLKIDDIIEELRTLAFWNIHDFVNSNNTIVNLKSLSFKETKPVTGIKVKETYFPGDIKEITTELRLADKKGALVDLGRHLGMFKEDDKQKKIKIKISRK